MLEIIQYIDYSVLGKMHLLALSDSGWITPVLRVLSFIGDKGWSMFLLAFILMLFPKTRKTGICMFGAVTVGTVLGNFMLKPLVNRTRPFATNNPDIYAWWQYVGAPMKESASFPSGHVMAVAAGMLALYLVTKKKLYIVLCLILSVIMGISRCYFMVHYCTDVLGGFVVGIISAIISFYLTNLLFEFYTKYLEQRMKHLWKE